MPVLKVVMLGLRYCSFERLLSEHVSIVYSSFLAYLLCEKESSILSENLGNIASVAIWIRVNSKDSVKLG